MPHLSRHDRERWHREKWNRWQGQWPDGWSDEYALRKPEFRLSARARLLIPVVISLLLQVPLSLFLFVRVQADNDPAELATLLLAFAGPLSLLAARRFPGPVVAFVAVAGSLDLLLAQGNEGPPYIALAFAIVGAIVRGARIWAWISVGTSWVASVTVGLILGMSWHPARIAVTTLGILIVFGVGEAFRTRREHYEEFRRTVARRKQTEVQAERVRIARELHDVLAHSLSQINVQASVGLHLMDKQPEKASEALASIKETSKTALDEVRSVLGVLRAEDGQDPSAPLVPEPDLSRLPGLVASVTSQGVDVTLENTVDGAPKAVQLAIYRIVQESLTNVVRHANASVATVDVRIDQGAYVTTVSDDGQGLTEVPAHGESRPEGGRGLLGMRERAELLGGTLQTSHSPLGGLAVTARIPVKEHLE